MDEMIKIPIYFTENKGVIEIDAEEITDEFSRKLAEIMRDPKKFLEA